jgi:hypothetical protein
VNCIVRTKPTPKKPVKEHSVILKPAPAIAVPMASTPRLVILLIVTNALKETEATVAVLVLAGPAMADNSTPQLGWIKSSKLQCEPWTDGTKLCLLKREEIAVPVYSRFDGKIISCIWPGFKGENVSLQPIDEHNGYKLVTLYEGYNPRNRLEVDDKACQEMIFEELRSNKSSVGLSRLTSDVQ